MKYTLRGMHIGHVRFLIYSKSSADQFDCDLLVCWSALGEVCVMSAVNRQQPL